jgi:hypothetical protein
VASILGSVYFVTRLSLGIVAVGLAGASSAADGAATPTEPTATYSVRDIRAYPWYQQTGKFGDEELIAGGYTLSNSVVARGGPERLEDELAGPTAATLVVAQIDGPFRTGPYNGEVAVVVRTGARKLAEVVLPLRELFSRAPTAFVPLLVYRTGCDPLDITVSLKIKGKVTKGKSETVQFHCGE